jgi:hypothetical protein
MVIFKLWNYQTKVNILKAHGGKEIKIHSQSIRFVSDLSARLMRKRKEYIQIRQSESNLNSASRQCCGYGRERKGWDSQAPTKP